MALRPRLLSRSGRGRYVAWLVLAVSLGLSLLAWQQAREAVLAEAEAQFEVRVSEISRAIQLRMHAYEQVLRGGVGMVYATGEFDREQWRIYVQGLQLEQNFPGIQGMGYAAYLQPHEVSALEQHMHAEGFAEFRLWPASERELYSAIISLEPFNWRNQRAFGYDMLSEPARRAAMLEARDTGEAVVTDTVTLVQETTESPQAGFLMYLPVYAGGALPATVELRRERLQGFVYAPFRMYDLMQGILGREPDLQLRIYGDIEAIPATLTYSSERTGGDEAVFESLTHIDANGQVWALQMFSRPSLGADALKRHEPGLVLLSGVLISLLLFAILRGMADVQRRALRLADKMTTALRRSEAKYGSLAQAAMDAIIIAGNDGRIVSWNRGASVIFGYSEQDVLGRPWTLVLPERLRDSYRRAHDLITDEEDSRLLGRVLDLNGVRRSGEEFPMELSLARWGSDEVFVSGIIRDVSARKQAEEALRLSEERFRVALKGADVVVFNQDRDLRYTWSYNESRIAGAPRLVGHTDRELFPNHPLLKIKQRVLDSGQPAHEKIEISVAGQSHHFDLVLEPVWDRGMAVGLSGAAMDITALKRAEHELRASEARFRATFENAAIGIVVTDTNGTVLEANPGFQRMLGYQTETLRGRRIIQHLHPDDVETTRARIDELLRGERAAFKQKTRYLTREGGTLWASLAISLVRDEAGSPSLAIHMVEDITELKSTEEALARAYQDLERRVEERTAELREQTEALARSNAELEQFAYVASHDLQEPLRSISGFAQLLERRYEDKLAVDGKEFIHFIVEGTGRMRRLINDVLAFSRVGAREKRYERVSVDAVLEQTLTGLSGILSERGARIDRAPLPAVWGDEMDLQQLFQNLIANAVKFNRADTPRVRVTAEEQSDEWLFAVRDNGIGIDPSFFERIFTIFQRGVRSEEYDGTGLGLAICKKIIDRHGGRIWLESAPGAGTTVFFTLKKPPA